MGVGGHENSQSDILDALKEGKVFLPGQIIGPYSQHLLKQNIENNLIYELERGKIIRSIILSKDIRETLLKEKSEYEREINRLEDAKNLIGSMQEVQNASQNLKLLQQQLNDLCELRNKLEVALKQIDDRLTYFNGLIEKTKNEIATLGKKANHLFNEYLSNIEKRFDLNALKESFSSVVINLSNGDKIDYSLNDIHELGKQISRAIREKPDDSRYSIIKDAYFAKMEEKLKQKYPGYSKTEINNLMEEIKNNPATAQDGHLLCKSIQSHIEVTSIIDKFEEHNDVNFKLFEKKAELLNDRKEVSKLELAKEDIKSLQKIADNAIEKKECPPALTKQLMKSGNIIVADIKKTCADLTNQIDFDDDPKPVNRIHV